MAMSRVSRKQRKRGCHCGRYFTLERNSDSICHQRDATSSSRRNSRTNGPAPIRAPSSNAERKTAKLSETRRMPSSRPAAMIAVTISSVTPLSARGLRRITSRENPSVPHGTKDKMPATSPCRARLGLVRRARGPRPSGSRRRPDRPTGRGPSRTRVRSRCRARRRSCRSELQFVGRDVAVPTDPGVVPQLLQPAARPGGPGRMSWLSRWNSRVCRTASSPSRMTRSPASAYAVAPVLAGPDHGRRPAVRVDLTEPGLDRARPVVRRADRITAGQTDTEVHPVADGGAAGLGEDHGLVAPGVEVGQRILRGLGDQRPDPRFVRPDPSRPPAAANAAGPVAQRSR